MTSIGEALISQLVKRDVDTVFGIPGVHTVELYRGLAMSGIRHVTPRHEQGAGFMADGYARTSGKPGVAFVTTGPGLSNTLTAMGQARADSVPMLVISGVNVQSSLGKGLGHLHELPDQQAMVQTVALKSERIKNAAGLLPALEQAFKPFHSGRPGPTHIEIPLDVAGTKYSKPVGVLEQPACSELDPDMIRKAVDLLAAAKAPLVLAGGGAKWAASPLRELAETLGAPVVQTVNARGLMHGHPLGVPASPSLKAVRELIESSDVVLAIGTELGQTDFDMYATGTMATMPSLIRIDLCPEQLVRHEAALAIVGDAVEVVEALLAGLKGYTLTDAGALRAEAARIAAFEEIGPEMRTLCDFLQAMREAVPNALMVGDSVYPIYAGNLYYDHDRPGGWFNAATGFGALGYGIPAAIGAAIAEPDAPVMCIVGDGGAQFSLPEMMCAVDEKLPITFLIWNNFGYQEIATSMQAGGVSVIGCDPTPPDFEYIARSCGMQFWRIGPDPEAVTETLKLAQDNNGPRLIEVRAPNKSHSTP